MIELVIIMANNKCIKKLIYAASPLSSTLQTLGSVHPLTY